MRKPLPLEDKFWPRVVKTEGCWLWTGKSTTPTGYGLISIRRSGNISSHRASWMIHYGSIPDGKWVLHHCDNPKCVRPDHLFLGTAKDNSRDRDTKGRGAKGEKAGCAKIKEQDAIRIRRLRQEGKILREIASEFGLSISQTYRITRNESWSSFCPPI